MHLTTDTNYASPYPDVRGPFVSLGHNLIGDGTGSTGFGQPGDQVGTPSAPIDPMLSPLGNYGGPTPTMVPLPRSPALDAADNNLTAANTDQRGYARVNNRLADIGAVEVQVTGTVGSVVWNDVDQNGIQDPGEVGLAGVTVRLLDSRGAVIATTTTDSAGNYLFTDLAWADYQVEFVLLPGFVFTVPDEGSDDALDSDADPLTGRTVLFSLAPETSNLTLDAGMYLIR